MSVGHDREPYKRINRSRYRFGCGLRWTVDPESMCQGGLDHPHGKGHFWWVTGCQTYSRSIFSTLFANGSSDVASGYRYCNN